jgi:hypothetical protein
VSPRRIAMTLDELKEKLRELDEARRSIATTTQYLAGEGAYVSIVSGSGHGVRAPDCMQDALLALIISGLKTMEDEADALQAELESMRPA